MENPTAGIRRSRKLLRRPILCGDNALGVFAVSGAFLTSVNPLNMAIAAALYIAYMRLRLSDGEATLSAFDIR